VQDQLRAANVGSSVYFVTVVVVQMGHLLSVRTKVPYFASLFCACCRAAPAAAATAVDSEEGSVMAEEAKDARTAAAPARPASAEQASAAVAAAAAAAAQPAAPGFVATVVHKVRWTVVCAWIGSVVTALIFTQVEFINRTCGTGPVPAKYWGYAFAWSIAIFCVGECRKWLFHLYPESALAKRLAW